MNKVSGGVYGSQFGIIMLFSRSSFHESGHAWLTFPCSPQAELGQASSAAGPDLIQSSYHSLYWKHLLLMMLLNGLPYIAKLIN